MKEDAPIEDGNIIRSKEERAQEARKLNLMSNLFMNVVLRDKKACEHVLRILTGKKDLKVLEVRTQYVIPMVTSHDAWLDVLAEDGDKVLYNIEIQRHDTVDHARRTRFYGSMIDSEYMRKGYTYKQLPDVQIFYISETDLWKKGKVVYRVKKYFDGTDVEYDDGRSIIYVNAAVDDGTETAKLMKYFMTADPNDLSQGELSKRVHYLKCDKGGQAEMCEISEGFVKEGRIEGTLNAIRALTESMHWTPDQAMAMLKVPESEWKMYSEMLQMTAMPA